MESFIPTWLLLVFVVNSNSLEIHSFKTESGCQDAGKAIKEFILSDFKCVKINDSGTVYLLDTGIITCSLIGSPDCNIVEEEK